MDEVKSNGERVKPLAKTIMKLRLSEDIRQASRQ